MKNSDIHIIGGGIIGLTSAWYLNQAGYSVTVIERNDFSDSTSHGNAGMIVPSHFVPMASPGVIKQGLKWMFDSKSPFYIKPRLSLELVQWLWGFYKLCNVNHVNKSMPVLYEFNEWSKQLYKEFSDHEDFSFCFEQKGLLMLYKTAQQEQEEIEMAHQASALGISAEICDHERLNQLEPDIQLDVRGGVFFKGDAHLYPNKFIKQLYSKLKKNGVNFITGLEVIDFKKEKGLVNSILFTNGQTERVNKLVISAGSWTPFLLKKLGVKILLQDGKGYSVTMKSPAVKPRIPTILTESKVAVTPMGQDLRIGGTLELGGLSERVNKNRLKGIIESLPRYYTDFDTSLIKTEKVWLGYRPCTPDGMPYIGNHPTVANLTVATGHGMMGMSMGPATGKLVSELVQDEKTSIGLDLFKPDRRF